MHSTATTKDYAMSTLITIPADPTRVLAVAACWPGVGYWSFAKSAWVAAFDPAACLLRFTADADDPGWQSARVRARASVDVQLRLYALDASGHPVGSALDVETLSPDPADFAGPAPTVP